MMIRKGIIQSVILMSFLCSALGKAQEPVFHLETVITGNQEQPAVIFIMPWQPVDPPKFEVPSAVMRTPESLLVPMARPEFQHFIEARQQAFEISVAAGSN